MTLLDIRNQLFTHFCERDTFSTSDFSKIKIEKDMEDKRDILIRAALKEMVELGVSCPAGDSFWILSSPVSGAGQSVQLSMRISEVIAATIETSLTAREIEHEDVDRFNLHEGHIWQLIEIINDLLETEEKE